MKPCAKEGVYGSSKSRFIPVLQLDSLSFAYGYTSLGALALAFHHTYLNLMALHMLFPVKLPPHPSRSKGLALMSPSLCCFPGLLGAIFPGWLNVFFLWISRGIQASRVRVCACVCERHFLISFCITMYINPYLFGLVYFTLFDRSRPHASHSTLSFVTSKVNRE